MYVYPGPSTWPFLKNSMTTWTRYHAWALRRSGLEQDSSTVYDDEKVHLHVQKVLKI